MSNGITPAEVTRLVKEMEGLRKAMNALNDTLRHTNKLIIEAGRMAIQEKTDG